MLTLFLSAILSADFSEAKAAKIASLKIQLKEAKIQLGKARKGTVDTGKPGIILGGKTIVYPSEESKKEEIQRCKDRIAEIEKEIVDTEANEHYVPEFRNKLEAGNVGTVSESVRVFQVIDESNMLAEILLPVEYKGSKGITRVEFEKQMVWVSGVDMTGTPDDERVTLKGTFEVVGTKSYTAALGTKRTIMHIQPCEPPKLPEKPADEKPAKKPAKPAKKASKP